MTSLTDRIAEITNFPARDQSMVEATAKAYDKEVAQLFTMFTNCQKVSPYSGWDLDQPKAVYPMLLMHEQLRLEADLSPSQILHNYFVRCLRDARTSTDGFNITVLGRLSNVIRAYLELPSIRELNPDIAKAKDAAKRPEAQHLFKRFGNVT